MSISYITNEAGEKTAVIVPIEEWNNLSKRMGIPDRDAPSYKPFDASQISGRWNRPADDDEVAIIREMRADRKFE